MSLLWRDKVRGCAGKGIHRQVTGTRSNAVKKRKAINIQWDIDEDDYECGAVPLPLEIEIPNNVTDLEDIADYISDVTGFCHKGFELEE